MSVNLKTDYVDAIYTGNKKYTITSNSDGTSGIADATEYAQAGTQFGAKDINDTNTAVTRLSGVVEVALSAMAWTGDSAPYVQTIAVSGVTAEDEPILVSLLADGASADIQKAYSKAFSIISAGTGTTGDGTVTFKVYKKPATDIKVGLKGV